MIEQQTLKQLLSRARRRFAANLVWEQTAWAIAAGAAGALLLLLLGTQILNWYWLVLVSGAAVAVGVVRTRRGLVDSYQLAQRIDRRLALEDTLSTAVFFEGAGQAGHLEHIRAFQRGRAEQIAAEVDSRAAVPIAMPRAAYPAAALCAAVIGMFALRYGVRGNLDLRAPLIQPSLELFQTTEEMAAVAQQPGKPPFRKQPEALAVPIDQRREVSEDSGEAPDSVLETVDVPEVNNEGAAVPDRNSKMSLASSQKDLESQQEAGQDGEASDGNPEEGSTEESQRGEAGPKSGPPPADGQRQAPTAPEENSSLMEKMRDAMANLLSKLKISPQQSSSRSQSASQQQGEQRGRPQPEGGQKGMTGSERAQADSASNADQQGDQQAEGGEQSQSAQGRGSETAADRQSQQDARSGMGKQDGSKDLKEAEQLAAMGKISEIIGKRSASITGEVMVEVSSGKQQLRTQYAPKSARHSESGGEIHRDEVPLVLQPYVQQYFEEVRKTETNP